MSSFQLITVNDNENFCTCCGKQGLSKVAWLLKEETNEENHYGVVCAGKLLSSSNKKELKNLSLKSTLLSNEINNLKKLENNISDWFDSFQIFYGLYAYEIKLIPNDIMVVINYLRVVLCYDGKSLNNSAIKNRFNELNFIDFNDLLTESKSF
jgi:hypothetical protein